MPLSSEERVLRARIAALTMHSKNDSRATTAAARAAFNRRFEDQVDPDNVLPEAERRRRAAFAKRAHFTKMALASARARRKAAAS